MGLLFLNDKAGKTVIARLVLHIYSTFHYQDIYFAANQAKNNMESLRCDLLIGRS
jgi:hypothetical protein